MRQRRLLLVLLLALASGAVAGYSILQYLRQRPTALIASPPRNEATTKIVVAARELAMGELVTEEDVKELDWPGSAVPEGYATSIPQVTDRGVVSPIHANEPILDADLAGPGQAGLAPVIPMGMRAKTFHVDEVSQVAGWAQTGSVVDVILVGNQGGPIAKTILQNIQVVGHGQTIAYDEEGVAHTVTTVTVLLSPEDAEKLALATNEGSVQLTLKNPLDLETIETRGERTAGLYAGAGRRAPSTVRTGGSPAAPAQGIMEIYRGGVKTLISY